MTCLVDIKDHNNGLISCTYCDKLKPLDQLRSIKDTRFKTISEAKKRLIRLCDDCINEDFDYCENCYKYKNKSEMESIDMCEKCFNNQYDGEW